MICATSLLTIFLKVDRVTCNQVKTRGLVELWAISMYSRAHLERVEEGEIDVLQLAVKTDGAHLIDNRQQLAGVEENER
jgi:hypothetical protein